MALRRNLSLQGLEPGASMLISTARNMYRNILVPTNSIKSSASTVLVHSQNGEPDKRYVLTGILHFVD